MTMKRDFSIDIYHRIYRLVSRKVAIDQIAVTLDLPVNAVRNVVDQLTLSKRKNKTPAKSEKIIQNNTDVEMDNTYLDVYILHRMRFTIMDLTGMIVQKHLVHLQAEFDKMLHADVKSLALLMSNVRAIDVEGIEILKTFHKSFVDKGRYTAVLDPSLSIESFIDEHELEKTIPVFGTEKMFEEKSLKRRNEK